MPDIVCIGAANVDMIGRVERFPGPDDEVMIDELKLHGGGSASNVAIGLSRLGHSAGFVGILGTDHFADFLINEFKKEGVDHSKITRIEGTGGIVMVNVNPKGERIIFVSDGVAVRFNKTHVPAEYIQSAKFLFMSSIIGDDVIEAFEHASKLAKNAGVKVVMDPGTIFTEKPDQVRGILKNCYAILPSDLEAEMLTGLKGEEAGKKLLEYGPKVVVITQGKDGCLLVTKSLVKQFPTENVGAVDTTGAGDSFSAAFIAALLDDKSLESACEFANYVASISVTKEGARSTPTKQELDEHKKFDHVG